MTIVFTISVEKSRRRRTADEHNNNPLHVLPTRVAEGQQLRGENRGKRNTTKDVLPTRVAEGQQLRGENRGKRNKNPQTYCRRALRKDNSCAARSREELYLYPFPPLLIIIIMSINPSPPLMSLWPSQSHLEDSGNP